MPVQYVPGYGYVDTTTGKNYDPNLSAGSITPGDKGPTAQEEADKQAAYTAAMGALGPGDRISYEKWNAINYGQGKNIGPDQQSDAQRAQESEKAATSVAVTGQLPPEQRHPTLTPEQEAAEKAKADKAKQDAIDQDQLAAIEKQIQASLGELGTSADTYLSGAEKNIEEGYNTSMTQAQREESRMARRAGEQAAMMGGSAGGGMSQAGVAQAALGGLDLQNQAALSRTNAKLTAAQNAIAMKREGIKSAMDWSKDLYNYAKTDQQRKDAMDWQAKLNQAQMDNETLLGLLQSGEVTNLDEIMARLK